MSDHDEIRRLMAEYCHLVDDGRLDDWVQLFADDAVVRVGRHVFEGRDAIRGWIDSVTAAAVGPSRHLIVNSAIEVGDVRAEVTSDFLLVAATREILVLGRYDDVLVRTDARWRIADRTISMLRG